MTRALTRRRFLTISAAAAALPGASQAAPSLHWRGRALGAEAQILFHDLPPAQADALLAQIRDEVSRLEWIFSLYREGSDLRRLNAEGVLPAPSPDMLTVLSLCRAVHAATGGRFDPTVQAHWAAAMAQDASPARSRVGFDRVRFDASAVRFGDPGMAMTLNGVAQGYITDRISALLRQAGLNQVLIDMGEIAALGPAADGAPWTIPVALPTGQRLRSLSLQDRALATSAPHSLHLPNQPVRSHIVGPHGENGPGWRLVSISAPDAATADALSTAACLMERPAIDRALAAFSGARAEILDPDF